MSIVEMTIIGCQSQVSSSLRKRTTLYMYMLLRLLQSGYIGAEDICNPLPRWMLSWGAIREPWPVQAPIANLQIRFIHERMRQP